MYVLDVSGHGVQAALLSVTLSRLLSPSLQEPSILTRSGRHPSRPDLVPPVEVAEVLNRRFPMDAETGQYFTLIYAILDCESGAVRYVTAGHPGPVLVPREGAPRMLDGYGLPIGFIESPDYEEHEITLEPGDRLFLITDGLLEAPDPAGEQFGDARLCRALAALHNTTLSEDLAALVPSLQDWCGCSELPDDVAALAVELESAEAMHAAGPFSRHGYTEEYS
jgi:sigma-B regulation protein RsbU (phosphoserine phosphatase)